MDWRDHAACLDADPELFFPVNDQGPALLQIAAAKTVCQRCPVIRECLSWALEAGEAFGVWGGLSEGERRAMGAATRRVSYGHTETRCCSGCQQTKPLGDFGRDAQSQDGISRRCKVCRAEVARRSQRRVRQGRQEQEVRS